MVKINIPELEKLAEVAQKYMDGQAAYSDLEVALKAVNDMKAIKIGTSSYNYVSNGPSADGNPPPPSIDAELIISYPARPVQATLTLVTPIQAIPPTAGT